MYKYIYMHINYFFGLEVIMNFEVTFILIGLNKNEIAAVIDLLGAMK